MKPRTAFALGLASLIAAQVLASRGIAPLRASTVSAGETFKAIKPGEFAGTLLLGGFRGLACDLLWMRGYAASEHRRYYESVAIYQVISQIQPRFEQVWEYMSWDMAYNISAEVDDEAGKWSWFIAGLDAAVRGCTRNPDSERLLRNLAWMFHHKGDTFHQRVLDAEWAALLNPMIAELNRRQPAAAPLVTWPTGTGRSNFQLSAYLYEVAIKVAEVEGKVTPPFVRRLIPHAFEKDGNLWRNQGQHLRALTSYLDALERWRPLLDWLRSPVVDEQDERDRAVSYESTERNEGRMRRKAAELARILAPDPATGAAVFDALMSRDDAEARRLIALPGWKETVSRGGIVWVDGK